MVNSVSALDTISFIVFLIGMAFLIFSILTLKLSNNKLDEAPTLNKEAGEILDGAIGKREEAQEKMETALEFLDSAIEAKREVKYLKDSALRVINEAQGGSSNA